MREVCYIVEATADESTIFLVDMAVTTIRTDRFEYKNLDRRTFQQRFSVSNGRDPAEDVHRNGDPVILFVDQLMPVYVAIYHSARRASRVAAECSAELRAYSDHFVAARETIPAGSPSP